MPEYRLLLIDTHEDIILVTPESCLRCLQIKKKLTILKDFGIITNSKDWTKINVKIYNVKCECS